MCSYDLETGAARPERPGDLDAPRGLRRGRGRAEEQVHVGAHDVEGQELLTGELVKQAYEGTTLGSIACNRLIADLAKRDVPTPIHGGKR